MVFPALSSLRGWRPLLGLDEVPEQEGETRDEHARTEHGEGLASAGGQA